jgi:heme-degrading monooxygenase HmoA
MHAQMITYQLKDISEADYVAKMVAPDAPILATVPGLLSKVWLANKDKNEYGGFYLWRSREDMEAFMGSDLVKAVVSRPFLFNVHSNDYEIREEASRVTRGLK